jgi:hypothetical protein
MSTFNIASHTCFISRVEKMAYGVSNQCNRFCRKKLPMNTPIRSLASVLLLVLALSLQACSEGLSGGPVGGAVLEEGTNTPIPGATVVVHWLHHQGDSGTVCYHVETATTDENGKFHVPQWFDPSDNRTIRSPNTTVTVYKQGYGRRAVTWVKTTKDVVVPSFTGTRAERLKELLGIASVIGCYGYHNEKVLVPVYKALHDEAKGIASTEKDRNALIEVRRRAVHAWRGSGPALLSDEVEEAIRNDPYLREQFE